MKRLHFISLQLTLALAIAAENPPSGAVAASLEEWVESVVRANAMANAGLAREAGAAYESALAQARAGGDRMRSAVVLFNLGRLRYREGLLLESQRAFLQALAELRGQPDSGGQMAGRIYTGVATIYVDSGQYWQAEAIVRRALAECPGLAAADRASLAVTLGVALMHSGRNAEARPLFLQTAEEGLRSEEPQLRETGALALANAGRLDLLAGRKAEALQACARAAAVLEELPSPWPGTNAGVRMFYAEALRETGDVAGAEEQYRRALAAASGLGANHPALACLYEGYARLLRTTGRKAQARRLAAAARRIVQWSARENLSGHVVSLRSLAQRK